MRWASVVGLLFLLIAADGSHGQIECPTEQCECEEPEPNKVIINCRFRGLTTIPVFSPSNFPYYELTLASNDIEEISTGQFSQLNIERLDISGNPLSSIDDKAFDDLKDVLKVILLEADGASSVAFPTAVSGLTRLTSLHLTNFDIATIPSSALSQLTSLEELKIQQCGLRDLLSVDLQGPHNTLRHLDVSDNNLNSVPTAALASLSALEELLIGKNSLSSLPQDSFQGVANLKSLDLSQNGFTGQVHANAFRGLENTLQVLNMKLCQLTDSKTTSFKILSSLLSLDISDNSINNIVSDIFANLNQLQELYMIRNTLSQINRSTFSGVSSSLVKLHLEYNPVSMIAADTFLDFRTLRELYMDSTDASKLNENSLVSVAGTLEVLSLDNVGLRENHWAMIQPLTSLHTLTLSTNSLQSIPELIFAHFSQLDKLDLKSTELADLPQFAFHGLEDTLVNLDLSSNQLVTLSECTLSPERFPEINIFSLMLGTNPLRCDCRLLWLHTWLFQHQDDILFQFVEWRCDDNRLFRTLDASDLVCDPPIEPEQCEDPPVVTTPPPLLTVHINQTTDTTVLVTWAVTSTEDIQHFLLTLNKKNSSEDGRQIQFHRDVRQALVEDLVPATGYVVCVSAVRWGQQDDSVCVEIETVADPGDEPQGAKLEIILGSVFGALFFIIVIVVVVLCCCRKNRDKNNPFDSPVNRRSSLPTSGYNSQRFSRDKPRAWEIADAMKKMNDEEMERKLEGLTVEEQDRMFRLLARSGGSCMSVASMASAGSQRYLPEPPPESKAFGVYLNPMDVKENGAPSNQRRSDYYDEIPADEYEILPDSYI